jgi:CBS domain-containing protein
METEATTIKSGATYEEVARALHSAGCGSAPVVDEAGKLIGMVSERDLFRILFPFYKSFYENPELYVDYENRENKINEIKGKPVEVFMARDVAYVTPDMPIMRAGALILARAVRRLPVVEDSKIVGTVTWKIIYKELVKSRLGL